MSEIYYTIRHHIRHQLTFYRCIILLSSHFGNGPVSAIVGYHVWVWQGRP